MDPSAVTSGSSAGFRASKAAPRVSDVSPDQASPDGGEGLLGKGIIDDLPQRKILLTKGVNGLGFNIRGGVDAPYVKSDKGEWKEDVRREPDERCGVVRHEYRSRLHLPSKYHVISSYEPKNRCAKDKTTIQ